MEAGIHSRSQSLVLCPYAYFLVSELAYAYLLVKLAFKEAW